VAGRMKLELAQFRELAAFAQFGSDLDATTQKQLDRGQRITEVLKQPQYQPWPLEDQVMVFFAVTNGHLDTVPLARIAAWQERFLRYMDATHPMVGKTIATTKRLDEPTTKALEMAVADFNAMFLAG